MCVHLEKKGVHFLCVISSNNHYCTGFLGSNLHNSKNNDVTFNNNCQTTANEKQVRCIVLTGYERIYIVTDRPFDETIPLTETCIDQKTCVLEAIFPSLQKHERRLRLDLCQDLEVALLQRSLQGIVDDKILEFRLAEKVRPVQSRFKRIHMEFSNDSMYF